MVLNRKNLSPVRHEGRFWFKSQNIYFLIRSLNSYSKGPKSMGLSLSILSGERWFLIQDPVCLLQLMRSVQSKVLELPFCHCQA